MQNLYRARSMGRKGKIVVGTAVFVLVLGAVGVWKRQTILARYADMMRPAPPATTEVVVPVAQPVEKPIYEPTVNPPVQPATQPNAKPTEKVLPKEFNLAVPFVKQAPFGVWDAMHNEACEEASVLTVHAFYEKKTLTDEEQERELQMLVAVQEKLFGYFEDTDVAETVQFAKAAYGFSGARILENPSLDDIKREIHAGYPVIIPAKGKLLYNPNFKNGGPKYHMFVARGWNEKGFFTNDPGTRKGENYFYSNAVMSEAIHDWNAEEGQATGPRRVLVLLP